MTPGSDHPGGDGWGESGPVPGRHDQGGRRSDGGESLATSFPRAQARHPGGARGVAAPDRAVDLWGARTALPPPPWPICRPRMPPTPGGVSPSWDPRP
jgi:hypothetical protein